MRKSYPDQAGTVVYEQKDDEKKVVIYKVRHHYYAKLVDKKLGFLHHVPKVAQLSPMYALVGEDGAFQRTWSSSLNKNQMYDTIIAVQTDSPKYKRVIISNDNIDNVILDDIQEIKKHSTLFIDLELINGYAATYQALKPADTGGFIFRGVNEEGDIILMGR